MAQLVFQPIRDRIESGTYLLYDRAIGTGGMLTIAEQALQGIAGEHAKQVSTHLYGQEINNETYAICKADMLLKGERNVDENIIGGPSHPPPPSIWATACRPGIWRGIPSTVLASSSQHSSSSRFHLESGILHFRQKWQHATLDTHRSSRREAKIG